MEISLLENTKKLTSWRIKYFWLSNLINRFLDYLQCYNFIHVRALWKQSFHKYHFGYKVPQRQELRHYQDMEEIVFVTEW